MRRRELTLALLPLLAGCNCAPERQTRPHDPDPGYTGDTANGRPTGDTASRLGWVMLDSGATQSCGVLSDGRIVCWGNDDLVGLAPAGSFVQISLANDDLGCALGTDGTVSCWCIDGYHMSSICGSEPAGDAFVEVQSGSAWACAEDSNAELHCWGERRSTRDAPTGPVLDWAIEHGGIGCAVLPDSTVRCWGNTGLFSQHGETEPPPLLAPPADLKYTQVAVGRSHACALDTDGEVHCWGSTGLQVPYPAAPPGPFASIVAWSQITCGLRPDGAAECWYDFPQLEDVDDVPPEADGGPPWEPPPGKKWAQIGLGEWDACGLTLDGEAHCWMPQMDTLGEVLELPSLSSL